MKICILGAGAIGSLFGGYLAQHHDVTLICREGHASAVREGGLRITGLSHVASNPRAVTGVGGLSPPDVLFLTVKAYGTEPALEHLRPLLSQETVVVSLQNGLGNVDILAEAFPDARLVAGITSHGAILRSPGIVEHTGISYTSVGLGDDAQIIADLLNASGLETAVSANIHADIWCKAIVNSVINPIGTLLSGRNGLILEIPALGGLISRIVEEGVAVAQSRGIQLDKKTVLAKTVKVASETANNICSMRLDIERGRRTEIMQMNGAISRYGDECGFKTPLNTLITSLIRALEPAE